MRNSLPQLARNAFEVLGKLPRHGVGAKISRTTWQDNSYWVVTQVKTETDGKRGKAYGVLTWRGQQPAGEEPVRIRGTSKRVWRQLEGAGSDSAAEGWTSAAAAALRAEEAAEAEAAAPPAAEEAEGAASVEAPPS